MNRIVLNVQQGTPEWHAARAASDGTASEAPAMMGKSKYMSRTELLAQRKSGITKDVDASKQALFARGHAAEANARPIAETVIGDDLSPTTIVLEVEGLKLLASLDGITFSDDDIFEHKLFSEGLAAQVRAGSLEEHYTIQMDQELLVSGAKRCLFMTSDGTPENCVWMWYESNAEKQAALIAGWKQFHRDLADYVPVEIQEKPKAEPILSLPALNIHSEGAIAVHSNLDVFGAKLQEFVDGIDMEPNDDQGFANAEEQVKVLQRAQDALEHAESSALAMAPSIDEMRRTVALFKDVARNARLALEKVVKNRKEQIKNEEIAAARSAYLAHCLELDKELGKVGVRFVAPVVDFTLPAKNKRTLSSLRDALDTARSQAVINADHQAKLLRDKANWFLDNGGSKYNFLFADLNNIIQQDAEAFQIVVAGRIEKHEKAEADRLEEERERIRQEEEAKAAAAAAEAVKGAATILTPANDDQVPATAAAPAVVDTGATMKLGDIAELLGFSLTADFLRTLGIEPVGKDRAAVLYRASDFPSVCERLVANINAAKVDYIEALPKAA